MKIVIYLCILLAIALIISSILMWLWNALMPVIFNLPTITFWQSLGIFIISNILFKNLPYKQSEQNK
jgi:uncharacterized protein (DUF2062 family)